jgi:hydrogenase maturation protease
MGVGDENHRDDGVGPAVVRLLCNRTNHTFPMRTVLGPAEDLRNRWGSADLAVMVLAARHESSRPGMIHMLATELPQRRSEPDDALLGRLASLPHRVVVYTVEGASFLVGVGLSPSVKAAAERLADHVECQIAATGRTALPVAGRGSEAFSRPGPTYRK